MLKDLLKKSRSYRSFDESVTFTEEQLKEFVDHVRYAPSSINRQTLRYRLIFEPDEVRDGVYCDLPGHREQAAPGELYEGCGDLRPDDPAGRGGSRVRRLHDRKLPAGSGSRGFPYSGTVCSHAGGGAGKAG